jgi:N-acetylneuraminic acid mutarotase
MRKCVPLLLVLVFLTASSVITAKPVSAANPIANSWASKAPMHVARSGLGVAAVNGKIYAIGGTTESGFVPSAFGSDVYGYRANGVGTNEEYDPETNTWTYKASMPTPRLAFATAVYKNKIYCIGGQANRSYTGINEVYDTATDTWETKTPMPTPRTWVTANVVNGKIYLMSGYGWSGSDSSSKLNEVYDPETDSWETKTPSPEVPISGYNLASCVFDNKIFLFGGLTQDQHYQLNQIYDTETDTWSAGAYPPSSLGGGAAAATTGAFAPKRIYAIGPAPIYNPQGAPSYTNRVYYPRTDSWWAAADMPTKRFNFGIAVVNDTFYVIGGHTYSYPGSYAPVALNEQYVPISYGTPDPSYVPPDIAPPEIAVLSPENRTYYTVDVALNFTVNEPVSSMRYTLDGENLGEISGNTTLTGLPYGSHNLTVYATDAADNTGFSETIHFTIAEETKPFPTTLVAAASVAAAVVVGVGLLVYFKKRKH